MTITQLLGALECMKSYRRIIRPKSDGSSVQSLMDIRPNSDGLPDSAQSVTDFRPNSDGIRYKGLNSGSRREAQELITVSIASHAKQSSSPKYWDRFVVDHIYT